MPVMTLGDVTLDVSRRLLTGPQGHERLQPQELTVLMELSERAGEVVTRSAIFDRCWGASPVGDDSLNRIVSRLRRNLDHIGSRALRIETVPRRGYMLAISPAIAATSCQPMESATVAAVADAIDCWRVGLPRADHAAIAALETALLSSPDDAAAWGWLALLRCKAAEYDAADVCSEHIAGCERAARRALFLEPGEPHAAVALGRLVPIFGNWSALRLVVAGVLERAPDDPVALHELAVLEMATGRPRTAAPIISGLSAEDPHAAQLYYKRMFHLWTLGEDGECERVALAALQLWPLHPAIWLARFWILLSTGRAPQAAQLADDEAVPPLPPASIEFLASLARLVASGHAADSPARTNFVTQCLALVRRGPAESLLAFQALCILGETGGALEVARGYYLGTGGAASPAKPRRGGLSVPDQHRRVTQSLFIPLAAGLREDPRFIALCRDIGLVRYWRDQAITPDFLADRGVELSSLEPGVR